MSLSSGVKINITWSGFSNAKVQQLIDALPDPSVEPANLPTGIFSYLDEISPMALIELRAYLTSLKASVSSTD